MTGSSYLFTMRATDGTDTTQNVTRTVYRGHSVDISDPLVSAPKDIVLLQNYPNPFNPVTTIQFGIPSAMPVKISVFNIFGQKVRILTNKIHTPGYHSTEWDSRDDKNNAVSSGLYLYRMETPKGTVVRKMLLLK